jgi:Tfp pilus assembly protein PilF
LPKPLTSKDLNGAIEEFEAFSPSRIMKNHYVRYHKRWSWIAFCTVFVLASLALAGAANGGDSAANRERYLRDEVRRGARKVTVLAHVEYGLAAEAAKTGDKDQAEDHLRLALRYDPDYSDAHFAMARLSLVRMRPDAAVHLIRGVISLGRTFGGQARLALNAASTLSYVLLVLNLVVCVAFSIKYLPYTAHKLTERMRKRYNAAFPRAASYLILLSPVVLFADTIIPLAYLTVLCWLSMYRREKVLVVALVAPLVAAGFFDTHVRLASVLSDAKSLTSLVDRANTARSDEHIVQAIERSSAAELECEKNLALGLLYLKDNRYYDASDRLFKAVSLDPNRAMGYINLGNVHFLQADYEKALQGYRKAESIDPADPICQYNLAQAYIKTLLMQEASRSLQAAGPGVEKEKERYAEDAFEAAVVLPRLFSDEEMWRLSLAEARSLDAERAAEGKAMFPWLPGRTGAIIVILTLVLAVALSRLINPEKLTFQCSNCGMLTCSGCCVEDRDHVLCRDCAATVEGVTSEKVVEALLRQKRQSTFLRRKKSARVVSMALPGVRDFYYGHVSRGLAVAFFFSVCVVWLVTGGSATAEPAPHVESNPLWRTIAAAAGIAAAYFLSVMSKPNFSFKPQRHRAAASRVEEPAAETPKDTRAA